VIAGISINVRSVFALPQFDEAYPSGRVDFSTGKTCYASTALIAFCIRETTMALAKEDIEEIKEIKELIVAV